MSALTPDTKIRLTRKGDFLVWLNLNDLGPAQERLDRAYPEGSDGKGDPIGPDATAFLSVAWTIAFRDAAQARGELLKRIVELPGCGESAREIGLRCRAARPPEGHRPCSLVLYHDGDCHYPRREP